MAAGWGFRDAIVLGLRAWAWCGRGKRRQGTAGAWAKLLGSARRDGPPYGRGA